jgi:hypothetical protein
MNKQWILWIHTLKSLYINRLIYALEKYCNTASKEINKSYFKSCKLNQDFLFSVPSLNFYLSWRNRSICFRLDWLKYITVENKMLPQHNKFTFQCRHRPVNSGGRRLYLITQSMRASGNLRVCLGGNFFYYWIYKLENVHIAPAVKY